MAKVWKCTFNRDWLDPAISPEFAAWICPSGNNKAAAFCTYCKKTFNLSNMGKQAVISHMNGAKHKQSIPKSTPNSMQSYLTSSGSTTAAVVACTNISGAVDPSIGRSDDSLVQIVDVEERPSVSATPKPAPINQFVVKESAIKAEVLWSLNCIANHYSYRSCSNFSTILQCMLPDSDIAKQVSLGYTKIGYYIAFGLAPYFKSELLKMINDSSAFVACFDEAFNRISQKGQLDLHIRYWDNNLNIAVSRYLNSTFLGHATSSNILLAFKSILEEIGNNSKLIQISMDGPNVNWKFIGEYNTEFQTEYNSSLLETGSCSLHIVHGALQTGHRAAGWTLNQQFRCFYYLFKDSPARRSDFIEITGTNQFALKFCAHRWVENVIVCERLLKVLPQFRKYVESVSKKPAVSSFDTVAAACKDTFFEAKIEFFMSVGNQLEPFLKKFQTSQPMLAYVFDDIYSMYLSLFRRIVKPAVLEAASSAKKLMSIQLIENNLKSVADTDIGFGARKALPKKESDLRKINFQNSCRDFLISTIKKLIERSPLRYPLVRAISCLSPLLIASSTTVAQKRFDLCLKLLVEANRIVPNVADKAKDQFLMVITSALNSDGFITFKPTEMRLDTFWFELVGGKECYQDLWNVLRIFLTLSHGNATVESGFSVNEDLLVENLQARSLVAQRLVYDAISTNGGVMKVEITEKMLRSVKSSNNRYKQALEEKRQETTIEQQLVNEKKRKLQDLKELELKKKKLVSETATQSASIDNQIADLRSALLL